MRAFAALPIVGLVVLWSLALWLWPSLPERLPMHFDLQGTPDRYEQRSPTAWFLLPGLATVLAGAFAWLLPPWLLRLARHNSHLLKVPDRNRFRALPTEGRVRALAPTVAMLRLLAAEITLLFAYVLLGTHAVATGAASRLSSLPILLATVAIAATALGSIPFCTRAVRREAAAATSAGPSPR